MNKTNSILYKNIDLSTAIGNLRFSKEISITKYNDKYNIDYISCGEWIVLEDLELKEIKEILKKEFNLDEKKIKEILDESTFTKIED